MKIAFLIFIIAITLIGFGAYNDVSNLRLIQDSEDKNATYRYFNPSTFSLPEPKEITNKDKTKTLVINEEEIKKALEDATKKGFYYLDSGLEIYLHFIKSYAFIALIFIGIGGVFGFFIRSPIDEFDFEKLKEEYKKELRNANEKVKKAQETAKKAKIEAENQAEEELEKELNQLSYKKEEADKERRIAIQVQHEAKEAIQKANTERDQALKIADTATRKKNASYAAAERFKQKEERLKLKMEKALFHET